MREFLKKRYNLITLITTLFLLIFLCSDVLAVAGVTPASYEIKFKPGLKQAFSFDFFSDTNSNFEIYAEGDLADYVTFDKKNLIGGGKVGVLLELPNEIDPPGLHRLLIGARQLPDKKAGITFASNIRAVIKVDVPYPGKYAEMEFLVSNANINEPINFKIKITNKGRESINTNTYIDVFNGKKQLETLNLESYTLLPDEIIELEKNLSTENYKAGDYLAVANVDYEVKTLKRESKFRLGELRVEINDVTRNFKPLRINPMEIAIESFWNDPIDYLYANVSILDSNISFLTPYVKVSPWQQTTLVGYFDTSTLTKKSFKAQVTLFYNNLTTQKTFNLRIVEDPKPINYVLVALIALIVILLLSLVLLAFWVSRLAKRIQPKKNDNKK